LHFIQHHSKYKYKIKRKKKYNTSETILKFDRKFLERGKIDTPHTQMHNRPLSWLGTVGTSTKVAGLN